MIVKREVHLQFMLALLALNLTSCCVFKNKPEYQPSGSLACAEFGGGDAEDADYLMGFQIGNFLVYDLETCENLFSSEFSLEAGILYSRKGNERSFEETGGDGPEDFSYSFTEQTRTSYLDIPIRAKVPVYKGLSVSGGPQASILLGAKSTQEANGNKSTSKGTEGFNGLDIGLSVGINYELNNGLSFGFGYDHGLSNVYKSDYSSQNIKNRFYKATVGINLNKLQNR